MKVKLIKFHPAWNVLYPNEFTLGDELELSGKIVTSKNGRGFNAKDLCKSFSNHCSYPDIFEKLD